MGKSINLYLIDNDPTAKIKCTIFNWTGVVYKIPRNELKNYTKWNSKLSEHIKQTGIYFLIGENDKGKPIIYIGQACLRKNGEGIIQRLLEHARNDGESYYPFWNEVLVLTTQNDVLGPTEISYLENRFTIFASEAKRYDVFNIKEPTKGNITEEKESEMEEFIKFSKLIVSTLGYKVFEKTIEEKQENQESKKDESPIFQFVGKYDATARTTNEGFIVLASSHISKEIQKSCPNAIIKARELNADKIKEDFTLESNIVFNSSSAAAAFVGGTSLSGNICWKTKDGKCPKDFFM